MVDKLFSTVFDATEPLQLHGVRIHHSLLRILCPPIGEGLRPHPLTFFFYFSLLLPLSPAFVHELFLLPNFFPKLFRLLIL